MFFNSNDLKLRKNKVANDILRKEYVSCIGNVEQFKEYVFECAVRNGYGEYEKTVVVSDGAAWIRAMCEELFPDGVPNIYKYVCDNRKKIDYGSSYKDSGFYIGSGPVESANKTVLQKRCKGHGMRWDEHNAQYILTLRSKVESKIWEPKFWARDSKAA